MTTTPQSETIAAVAAAFVAASAELDDITKRRKATIASSKGASFGYTYADLADVLASCRPTLARHGLALLQPIATSDDGHSVEIRTVLLHSSGEWLASPTLRLPAGRTAQETGSAVTYGRRYSALAFLGLAAEDDDGASAAPRQQAAGRPAQRPTRPPQDDSWRPFDGVGESTRTPEQPSSERSDAEAGIRELVAGVKATYGTDAWSDLRSRFHAEFGPLADLPVAQHDVALRWVEAAVTSLDTTAEAGAR